MAGYLLTEAASGDLQGIDDYLLTSDGGDAAGRVIQALVAAFELPPVNR